VNYVIHSRGSYTALPRLYLAQAPREDWVQGLRDGDLDALLALLLSQVGNLRRLDLGYDFTRRPVFIGKLLLSTVSDARHDLPDFRYLHEVSFLRRVDRDEAFDESLKNTAHVLPFFYLPAIERMAIMIQNLEEWTWPTAMRPSHQDSHHCICSGSVRAALVKYSLSHRTSTPSTGCGTTTTVCEMNSPR
jgi:hypothetical protein